MDTPQVATAPVAWVFPGQGSQAVGMGQLAVRIDPEAAALQEQVDDILGFPLSAVLRGGPADALQATPVQQPAVLTASVAIFLALRNRGVLPDADYVAGHSLGQYAAFVAAGAIAFPDALRLVRLRGELMEAHGAGAMAAIIGLAPAEVAGVASDAGAEVANYNSLEQTTVSGDEAAVERAMGLARDRGAKRAIRLPVDGAFHSTLMAPVAQAMAGAIAAAAITDARIPVITNVGATPITAAADVRRELVDHICASVQWVESVRWMDRAGVNSFYEVGPGKVLAGLIGRIQRGATVYGGDAMLECVSREEGIDDDGR